MISSWGGSRKAPHVFTEQGALALAGVLRGKRAEEVSVFVARAFVAMRERLVALGADPVVRQLLQKCAKRSSSNNARPLNISKSIAAIIDCLGEYRAVLEIPRREQLSLGSG